MATNKFTIDFNECPEPPANGYRVVYRPYGTGDPTYRIQAGFLHTPIVVFDNLDAPGTKYEGFLQADCGDGVFQSVPFTPPAQLSHEGHLSIVASGGDCDHAAKFTLKIDLPTPFDVPVTVKMALSFKSNGSPSDDCYLRATYGCDLDVVAAQAVEPCCNYGYSNDKSPFTFTIPAGVSSYTTPLLYTDSDVVVGNTSVPLLYWLPCSSLYPRHTPHIFWFKVITAGVLVTFYPPDGSMIAVNL